MMMLGGGTTKFSRARVPPVWKKTCPFKVIALLYLSDNELLFCYTLRFTFIYGRSRSQKPLFPPPIDVRFHFGGSFWVFQNKKYHIPRPMTGNILMGGLNTASESPRQKETETVNVKQSMIVPKTSGTILGVCWVVGNMRGVSWF